MFMIGGALFGLWITKGRAIGAGAGVLGGHFAAKALAEREQSVK